MHGNAPFAAQLAAQCRRRTNRTSYNTSLLPWSLPRPTISSWPYVWRNVCGTKLSINIICKSMLTYKFRKDMRLFAFFVVSLQLIWRLLYWGTDISNEFSYGKERDSSEFSKPCLEYLFVDVLRIKKRACLLTKRQFHVQYNKQNHASHFERENQAFDLRLFVIFYRKFLFFLQIYAGKANRCVLNAFVNAFHVFE